MMNRRRFVQAAALAAPAIGLGQAKPDKIKIGQIGVGHPHASGKMEVYRESEDFEVVGIVEPDDALWERAGKTYEGLKRMSAEQLLNTPGLQAVAVETAIRDLLATAEKCIAAGYHIHLDKPAGASMPKFQQLLDDSVEKGLTIQMGYMYRYNPAIVMLREFLDQGWLGDVFEIHAVMSKVLSAGARKELSEFKGGVMFELGGHIVDLVVGVAGKPEKVTAHNRAGADGLKDNMLAVLDYPNATATVKSAGIEVEGFARRHLFVGGTEGSFHIQPLDRPSARISLSKDRGEFKKGIQDVPFDPPYRRYVGDAIDFAKIIRGEKKLDFSPAHDAAVQETLLRASEMF
ncbi:MAG: putative dehydrogenase [Verrucomicrobiales bacterium]|jgi:predicted dehydrogenase